jgi:hypothetical protein
MKIIQLVSHQDKLFGLADDGTLYEKKQFSYDSAYSAWVKVITSDDVAQANEIAQKHHETQDELNLPLRNDEIN